MSWDIFVQNIPPDAKCVGDIPDNFRPLPIGPRSRVLEIIREVVPFADYSDPTCIHVDGPAVSMEIGMGDEDPISSFAFFIRGGDASAGVVADVLSRLKLRALDTGSESGIFDPAKAVGSFQKWQQFRDRVCKPKTG